jgi:hypothetical protein
MPQNFPESELRNQFEAIRGVLSDQATAAQLARPLAYWTTPLDHHLSYQLVDLPLSQLLATAFEDLLVKRNVGPARMVRLIALLRRMAADLDAGGDKYQLQSRFEETRDVLKVAGATDEQLARPLGYWVTPLDRQLPQKLLDWPLKQLLVAGFGDVQHAGFVGPMRMEHLIGLLDRIAREIGATGGAAAAAHADAPDASTTPTGGPEANALSAAQWDSLRDLICRSDLAQLTCGQVLPSLRFVPRRLWDVPLAAYLDRSLPDLAAKESERRSPRNPVVQAFRAAAEQLASPPLGGAPSSVRGRVPHIAAVETWLASAEARAADLRLAQLRQYLAKPLLEQVALDSSRNLRRTMQAHIERAETLKSVARQLGVSHQCVSQFLAKSRSILHARWPEGPARVQRLVQDMAAAGVSRKTLAYANRLHRYLADPPLRLEVDSERPPPPLPEPPKPKRAVVKRLAEFFHRIGYLPREDARRGSDEGCEKGSAMSEIRFVADSAAELEEIRGLLSTSGFRIGPAVAKGRQWCQSVYGPRAVARLLALVGSG